MDRHDCDPERLENTYRQFTTVNRLLSGWNRIYKNEIRPILLSSRSVPSILDIGCGGGDILRYLSACCRRDGIEASFLGIDPDIRSMNYLAGLPADPGIDYRNCTSTELLKENMTFDVVLSNHLMHHLTEEELLKLVSESASLSNRLVLFSDIERSALGYLLFRISAPLLFKNSYIAEDGLISIKKSYTKEELRDILPANCNVERSFPFRILVTMRKD